MQFIFIQTLNDQDDVNDLFDLDKSLENDSEDLNDLEDLEGWLDDDSDNLDNWDYLDKKMTPTKWLKRQVRKLKKAVGKSLDIF